MVEVANFLFTAGGMFFEAFSSWGVIGAFILSSFLIVRVTNFIKRFFR